MYLQVPMVRVDGGHQAQLPSCSHASGTTGPIVVIAPAGVSAVVSSCCEVSAVLRVLGITSVVSMLPGY